GLRRRVPAHVERRVPAALGARQPPADARDVEGERRGEEAEHERRRPARPGRHRPWSSASETGSTSARPGRGTPKVASPFQKPQPYATWSVAIAAAMRGTSSTPCVAPSATLAATTAAA